jgi:predicted transcriptional regulator
MGLEQRVIDELWVEEATAKELSEALGADESAVQVTLDRMMSQGKIKAYSVYAIALEGRK